MIEGGFCEKKDLCRVNFELDNLKPFPHLAFPHFLTLQNAPKQPSFDGELMASCLVNYFGPYVALGLLLKWRCWHHRWAAMLGIS